MPREKNREESHLVLLMMLPMILLQERLWSRKRPGMPEMEAAEIYHWSDMISWRGPLKNSSCRRQVIDDSESSVECQYDWDSSAS